MTRYLSYLMLGITMLLGSPSEAQQTDPNEKVIRIYFGGGSWYIDREQEEDLQEFIDEIEKIDEYEVELHGHTDNIGSIEFNRYLSEMRCQSVLYMLLDMDIERSVISLHEFGEESPIYSNNSWNGKLNNRRVDVIFRRIMM